MDPGNRGVKSETGQVPVSPFSSFFGLNLIALIFIGVAVSIWLLYYTDVFPEVAGILALGGAASWVGFILKLLAERRINDLQAWTDNTVFNSPLTAIVLSFFALVLIAAGNFRGGIQIEPIGESVEHTVLIHPVSRSASTLLHLLPSGQLHWTGWTSWWSPARVAVKVSGYPEAVVEVGPWQRVPLYVPNSLLRPVVLLRPSVALIDAVRDTSTFLELTVKDAGRSVAHARTAFDGHAIWVGGDADILVPQETEAAWHQELAALNSVKHLQFWFPPLAPSEFNLSVEAGQEIQVILRKKDNSVYATQSFKVRRLRSSRGFVQDEVLDVPPPAP